MFNLSAAEKHSKGITSVGMCVHLKAVSCLQGSWLRRWPWVRAWPGSSVGRPSPPSTWPAASASTLPCCRASATTACCVPPTPPCCSAGQVGPSKQGLYRVRGHPNHPTEALGRSSLNHRGRKYFTDPEEALVEVRHCGAGGCGGQLRCGESLPVHHHHQHTGGCPNSPTPTPTLTMTMTLSPTLTLTLTSPLNAPLPSPSCWTAL